MKRTYIQCPFEEKDEAKQLGARWDAERKLWYFTSDTVPTKWPFINPSAASSDRKEASLPSVPDKVQIQGTDYSSKKVPELKEECAKRGLGVSGTKDDLIRRLQEDAWSKMTVAELKAECKARGLHVSGKREDLVLRITASITQKTAAATDSAQPQKESLNDIKGPVVAISISSNEPEPSKWSIPLLKEKCKSLGLKVSGNKEELSERIVMELHKRRGSLTVDVLKEECRSRKIPVTGSKDVLLERLKNSDQNKFSSSSSSNEKNRDGLLPMKNIVHVSEFGVSRKRSMSFDPYDVPDTDESDSDAAEPKFSSNRDFLGIPHLESGSSSGIHRSSGSISVIQRSRNFTMKKTKIKFEIKKKFTTSKQVIYVIQSVAEYGSNGFHSFSEPTISIRGFCDSVKQANEAVRKIFKKNSPCGAGVDFDEVDEQFDRNGLLNLYTEPPDSETWSVKSFICPLMSSSGSNSSSDNLSTVYVAFSEVGYPADGFHSYSAPERKVQGCLSSFEDARNYAHQLLVKTNPWGWTLEDFESHQGDLDEKCDEKAGTLKLTFFPPDSERIKIYIQPARKIG